MTFYSKTRRGLTLIDVVVGTSIMVLVFLGIFGAFRISIELVFSTKAKTGAVSLITERMESVRALAYDDVGTVGGIPAGNLPQTEQVTLNGILYTVNTLVQYVDAPEDGLDINDENGIVADYKSVKIEVLWSVKDSSRSTFAVTHIAPVGIESLSGGGTLRVNVFNAVAAPIQGATVRVVNTGTAPTIDVTAQTNTSGSVALPGTPEATDYEITVTRSGYSTAQTYGVTAGNPNPSPAHVSVVEGQTTTQSLSIDLLGFLNVLTIEPPQNESFSDTFPDQSQLSATTSTTVSAGTLQLVDTAGVFETTGDTFSIGTAPSPLFSWSSVRATTTRPTDTTLLLRVYYYDGAAYQLIPDADLPNNSTGFSTDTIDISGLNVNTYTNLQLGAFFTTADTATTSQLHDWELAYLEGPNPLPNVPLTIHGSKTIGTDSGGSPVYKYDVDFTTNASGEWLNDIIEWDAYTLELQGGSGYDISERCAHDISIEPSETENVTVTLVPNTADTLRVEVTSGGSSVSDASINVDNGTIDETQNSSACGQAFFDNLENDTFTVTITKTGFDPHTENVVVNGDDVLQVTLSPL